MGHLEGLCGTVSPQNGAGATSRLVDLGTRPLRRYAPFMAGGSAMFGVAAIILLAQSGSGVNVFAEGRTGTAMSMPAGAASGDVVVYAVTKAGQPYPEVDCKLATSTHAYANFKISILTASSKGRTLKPVATVGSGYHTGDTLTCTSTETLTLVIGRNSGMTHLLQGLLAAGTALGSGLFALVGFAVRRRRPRPWP